jgi:hypothetical protein
MNVVIDFPYGNSKHIWQFLTKEILNLPVYLVRDLSTDRPTAIQSTQVKMEEATSPLTLTFNMEDYGSGADISEEDMEFARRAINL